MDSTVRVRTVAGFAVAVVTGVVATLVMISAWRVVAAPGDADSTFVPTAGCRLVDTRPLPDNVGPRALPLGAGEVVEVVVHGANGNCTGALAVPSDAVAVALNVTAVRPTARSNIRLYPADLVDVPLLSNLNVTAGAPPTPNKVDVKLSPDGAIKVFNSDGSVDVILDVVGYYTNSTLRELSQRVAALESAQPFAVTSRDDEESLSTLAEVVVSVTVTAPVDGHVTVNSSNSAAENTASDDVFCSITTGADLDMSHVQSWESAGFDGSLSQMAGTRTFDIAAGTTVAYNLVCQHAGSSGSSDLTDSVLTAIFTPAP